jgi:MraZ protein
MKMEENRINTFLGTFEHTIDARNRLILPAKIVQKIYGNVILSRGQNICLELRRMKDFESRVQYLKQLPGNKRDIESYVRRFIADSIDLEIDDLNRILLPAHMISFAKIDKNVVIVGADDKIEI